MAMESMPQSGLKTSLILKSSTLELVVESIRILIHIQEDFLPRRFQTPHIMPQLTPPSLMETVNTHQYIPKILLIPKNSILELVEEWIKIIIHTQKDFLPRRFQTLHTMP